MAIHGGVPCVEDEGDRFAKVFEKGGVVEEMGTDFV